MLLDSPAEIAEGDDVGGGQGEPGLVGGGGVEFEGAPRCRIADDLDGLGAEDLVLDPQVVVGQDVFVGGSDAGDDGFPEAPAGVDDQFVGGTGHRVGGEQHPGDVGVDE